MLPINPKQIPALYSKAMGLQNSGKLEEALRVYGSILNANANIPEVRFQVGRIFNAAHKYKEAVEHLEVAARLKPKEVAIWQVYCDALLGLGDSKAQSRALKALGASGLSKDVQKSLAARLSAPKKATAISLGSLKESDLRDLIAHMSSGQFETVVKKASVLLEKHPRLPVLHTILGTAYGELLNFESAENHLQSAIKLDENYAEAYQNYGAVLLRQDKLSDAETQIAKALKLAPKSAKSALLMADIQDRLEQFSKAEHFYRLAHKHANADYITTAALGKFLTRQDRCAEALPLIKKALASLPSPDLHIAHGRCLNETGQAEAALKAYDCAIELAPDDPLPYGRKAAIQQTLGQFDEAELNFRKTIELEPDNGEHYRVFSASIKLASDDPMIAQMIEKFEDSNVSDHNRSHLGFALAKAMEDSKQYDRVFAYLKPANELVGQLHPYDISVRAKEVAALQKAFDGVDYSVDFKPVISKAAPIFVTGMPRSGTTLVEQIIASHSRVSGAGEVGEFSRQAYAAMYQKNGQFQKVDALKTPVLKALADGYLTHMKTRLPEADLYTDKSIQTYMFMGLVKRVFPNAKIIVVRRDPRDNLLSIYRNMFLEGTHLYAYDLENLGKYYKLFVDMIDFWRNRLPDFFHEIHYEDLIANPEEECRKLIAACGLDWEDNCLNFHENKREVKTLSVYQVRQPIYKSSTKAWERYAEHLGPLFEALK